MKLNDLLTPYKFFSVATTADNEGILDFFKSMTMHTKNFSLRYDRGMDYFQFANEQSQKPFTFIMRNEEGKILGTASIATIPQMINGEEKLLGYLGDLRISPLLGAKIRLTWKKCYGEIIHHFKEIEEFKGISYLYSAILDENQNAMRSLLKNNDRIIYQELTTYESHNLFLCKPFSSFSATNFHLTNSNEFELRSFLESLKNCAGMQDDMGLLSSHHQDELSRRLVSLKGLTIDSFILIRNKEQKVVACVAPWICSSKKLVVERISPFLSFIGKILPLFGVPAIRKKKELKVLYLTHLKMHPDLNTADKKEILDLISYTFLSKEKRDYHLVSFFAFPGWKYENTRFFGQKTKGRFYQVMSKNEFEQEDFLSLANNEPAFEIGLA